MEDHITWSDRSAIREKVQNFNQTRDDFEVVGE